MKKYLSFGLLLFIVCLSSGCIIRSLHPWLSDATQVPATPLLGGWHDAKENTTVFFTENASSNLAVLVVSKGKEVSHFNGFLHKVGNTLLLQIGPEDRTNLGAFATLPGMLLYRVDLKKNQLRLYELNLEGFEERAELASQPLLPDSSEKNGFVLLAATESLESFVQTQLKDASFFNPTPYLSLRKLPEK